MISELAFVRSGDAFLLVGAISLYYLDFINLFLMILQLLTGQRQE